MSEEIKKVEELVVDDGSITVPIKNPNGEQIGVFKFRPSDIGIINRYNEIVDRLPEIVKPLEGANIEPSGEGSDIESMEIINEVEKKLFELIDYLFDGNAAEAFFGKMHAFSPVDGKFYCENVLDAVGAFISKRFEAEAKKVSAHVEKYTHGYKTGKHKDGKK